MVEYSEINSKLANVQLCTKCTNVLLNLMKEQH